MPYICISNVYFWCLCLNYKPITFPLVSMPFAFIWYTLCAYTYMPIPGIPWVPIHICQCLAYRRCLYLYRYMPIPGILSFLDAGMPRHSRMSLQCTRCVSVMRSTQCKRCTPGMRSPQCTCCTPDVRSEL